MRFFSWFILYYFCVVYVSSQNAPTIITIGGLFPLTGRLSSGGVEREAAARIAVENINKDSNILPNTELRMLTYDTGTSQAVGLTSFLAAVDEGVVAVVGAASSSVSQIIAIGGGVFNIPQLSYSSTSVSLSNKEDYPLFGRLVPADSKQGSSFVYLVSLYGWGNTLSAISTADEYGVGGVDQFILNGAELDVRVTTYQQFLSGATDIDVEMNELVLSESRVFLAFLLGKDAQLVFEKAIEYELIGDTYVWLCSDGCAQVSTFTNNEGDVIPRVRRATQGLIGLTPSGGKGELFESFLDDWEVRDPIQYPGAGDRTINLFAPHAYDCVTSFALAFDQLIRSDKPVNCSNIVETVKELQFDGLTGNIRFDENSDRIAVYDIVNLRDDDSVFTTIGFWDATIVEEDEAELEPAMRLGFTFETDIQFFDKSTNVPDLDVESPFDYWDCHKKKKGFDSTGKQINLETPDGDDPRYIADHYICDQFIDCDNMSDEPLSCNPSMTATFLSFGIITGILILTVPFFAICAIAFGFIWKKRRIRILSPLFLIAICFSCFLGYVSTFSWYGKPSTVGCNFQPWLLGLSINLLIGFLFAKTYRIWKIFKSPFKKKKVTDLQLFILVGIIMIPCVVILTAWTAFATPTATVKEVNGEDHFVCETGGLTGPPGGIVFFFVLVGYTSLILLFGVFLAFMTRNVPEIYSESKLVGYSVYNLTFLGAVVIPVFFVLRNDNPVAAWCIRTIAILYGFTATLWLQFVPPLAMLLFRDRCASVPRQFSNSIASSASAYG